MSLAACGDNIDDGGGIGVDAGGDGGDIPTVGTCGIVVRSEVDASTVLAVPVMFSRPDGSLIGTETTGVDGTASRADCVRDTMITVAARTGGSGGGEGVRLLNGGSSQTVRDYELVTYTHINPGDTVYFTDRSFSNQGIDRPFTRVNASFPQDLTAIGEVDGFGFDFACQGEETGPFPEYWVTDNVRPCNLTGQDDDDIDLLVYLYDEGPSAVGYSYLKDIPLVRGELGNVAETPVTMPAWTAGDVDNAFIVSNVPANADYVDSRLRQQVGGLNHSVESLSPAPGTPVASTTFWGLPEGFGEQSEGSAYIELREAGSLPRGGIDYERWKNIGHRYDFVRTFFLDLSEVLPTIAALVVSESDTVRPTIQWILDDSNATDVGRFAILGTRFWSGDGSYVGNDDSVDWFVVTPDVAAGSFRFPELPENIAALLEPYTFQVVPFLATINDAEWLVEWNQVLAAPGFNPVRWTERRGVIDWLPQPAAGSERRFRRSAWYRDDD
jgi:hypothetical protein